LVPRPRHDRAERAEAPAGHPEDGSRVRSGSAQSGEHGPVAPDRDHEIAGAHLTERRDHARRVTRGQLYDVDAALRGPLGQCRERVTDLTAPMYVEPDA